MHSDGTKEIDDDGSRETANDSRPLAEVTHLETYLVPSGDDLHAFVTAEGPGFERVPKNLDETYPGGPLTYRDLLIGASRNYPLTRDQKARVGALLGRSTKRGATT